MKLKLKHRDICSIHGELIVMRNETRKLMQKLANRDVASNDARLSEDTHAAIVKFNELSRLVDLLHVYVYK